MKDSEVRGIILKRLYEIRHLNHGMIDVPDGLNILEIAPTVLGNCAAQLDEQSLIKFRQVMGKDYRSGHASITSFGIDVVEQNAQASIAITFDQSINVHGSQNVQVGGQGNVQNVTMDIEKMISQVDSSAASVTEREEAKSLFKKISENKLVQSIIGGWLKTHGLGGA